MKTAMKLLSIFFLITFFFSWVFILITSTLYLDHEYYDFYDLKIVEYCKMILILSSVGAIVSLGVMLLTNSLIEQLPGDTNSNKNKRKRKVRKN